MHVNYYLITKEAHTGENTYTAWVLIRMFHKLNMRILLTGSVDHSLAELEITMGSNSKAITHSVVLASMTLFLGASIAAAQNISGSTEQEEAARVATSSAGSSATQNAPVFKDYRGVSIGMSAQQVRAKLENLKEGKGQDFLVFSDRESAQIYYDEQDKVIAISVDYFGGSNAPDPNAVLGVALQAKADGSMYQLSRYPDQGYWVSYNRTAGEKPIVTITMQKM
jgi:hypothetical protein